ncbi:MAG: hypothetical protein RJQ10_12370, partial [Haliea sp.]|uniref:hypothetical protein n=1 Tax=Haliea sp. TaxID=1932666 RepID=UPI0032EF1E8E
MHGNGLPAGNGGFGEFQRVQQAQQLGAVVGARGIVEAVPELRQRAVPLHGDAGAGPAGIGVTGTITVDIDRGLGAG